MAYRRRNDALFDIWSVVHVISGIGLGWVMDPFLALVILILWEPLEIFVLSPVAMKLWQREFGYESWRNSISDIVFDAVGVAFGYYLLSQWVAPPFFIG